MLNIGILNHNSAPDHANANFLLSNICLFILFVCNWSLNIYPNVIGLTLVSVFVVFLKVFAGLKVICNFLSGLYAFVYGILDNP